jgi:hypothetical protein
VIVTQNGQARAILQDPESYERLKTALGLLKLVAQGEADIRARRVVEQCRLFDELKSEFRANKNKVK